MKWFRNKEVVTCEYCNSDNIIKDELRCKSCGAPLKVENCKNTHSHEEKNWSELLLESVKQDRLGGGVRGGQGNYKMVNLDNSNQRRR